MTGDIHGRRSHRARWALKDTQTREKEKVFLDTFGSFLVIGEYSEMNNNSRYYLYVVFPFLIAPVACRDNYGVLVVVHYYRACYCSMAKIRLNT